MTYLMQYPLTDMWSVKKVEIALELCSWEKEINIIFLYIMIYYPVRFYWRPLLGF